MAWLLFPLSMWYAVGVAFRNLLFGIGLLKERSHAVTTIGVGNLCTGGAGKTPMVEYLLRLYKDRYRTAMLSRGYRRHTRGFVLASDESTVADIGDEPLQVCRKFNDVTVSVCENRNAGVEKLLSLQEPPQIVVLDDVYQHRYIKPTVNILLTEYKRPYFKDMILPFGNLREFRFGSRRADIVVVTKTPADVSPVERYAFRQSLGLMPYQSVFFTRIAYMSPVPIGDVEVPNIADVDKVLLVSGIANPEPLIAELSRKATVSHMRFPDHHEFTRDDMESISQTFAALPSENKMVVTTEKDAVRISSCRYYEVVSALPMCYIPVEMEFLDNGGEDFANGLNKVVKENIYCLNKRIS